MLTRLLVRVRVGVRLRVRLGVRLRVRLRVRLGLRLRVGLTWRAFSSAAFLRLTATHSRYQPQQQQQARMKSRTWLGSG